MEDEKRLLTRHRQGGLSVPPSLRQLKLLRLLGLVAAAVLSLLFIRSLSHSTQVERQRKAARRRQELYGLTRTQLELLPDDLKRHNWESKSVDELINHPLYHKPVPICTLKPELAKRYEVFADSYNPKSRQSRTGALLARDKPRRDEKYFVAINLYSSAAVLPSLARALYALVYSLGSHRFFVSIYENGSTDETPQQLVLLSKILLKLGVGHSIQSSGKIAGAKEGGRISVLADVRNTVMKPLYDAPPKTWDRVLFINDVVLCGSDLLELLLQHEAQGADMSCGMDYKELRIPEFAEQGYPLLFYDTWVAREMLGLPFYKIKWPSGDWLLPTPPLVHSPSFNRSESLLPFQVFSCFNGVTVIDAKVFEPPYSLRFRTIDGTDAQSECFLLCSDMWRTFQNPPVPTIRPRGAKLQVVPRVSVAYSQPEYDKARKDWNVTALQGARPSQDFHDPETIAWQRYAPKRIASYPYAKWHNEHWVPPF